jgi:hypothetical protein
VLRFAAITLPLIAPINAPAQSDETSFVVTGAGSVSCGRFLEALSERASKLQFEQWVEGYLAAYNYYNTTRKVRPPDAATIIAFAENYCRNNPLHPFVSVAPALVQELGGRPALHQYKK